MFRDDDPGLAQLREIALALPEAFERVSLGRPVFCAPKMFALCGGSIKQADGPQTPHPHSVLLKVDDSERPALQRDPRFFYPAYLGPYGWLGLDFSAADLDWNEVGELVDGGCPEFRGASLFGAQGSTWQKGAGASSRSATVHFGAEVVAPTPWSAAVERFRPVHRECRAY